MLPPMMHGALVRDEAVHARSAVDDVELGLVSGVAVARLLLGDVRSARVHRDAATRGVVGVDGVALVTLEPVGVQRGLPAEEVVERPVLLVEDDDVLDARVRRDRWSAYEQHPMAMSLALCWRCLEYLINHNLGRKL